MKTPKPSTPAPKSKLNTPRSGIIQKNSNSSKKAKLNIFDGNVTPTVHNFKFKEKYINLNSGKKNKSPLNTSDSPNTKKDGKKKSPLKRKGSAEYLEGLSPIKTGTTPKTGKLQNQNSPNDKFKQSKKSPEVQLGLDIETYLDKSSSKKTKNELLKSTPLRSNQHINSMASPTPRITEKIGQSNSKNFKKLKDSPKKKGSKPSNLSNEDMESKISELVDSISLTKAMKALNTYTEGNPREKDVMFESNLPFYVQINFIKEPLKTHCRIVVPHSLASDASDICMFIADKGIKKDPEDLVDNMKEVLKKCKVNCITEIMPWRKALRDHTQFEQKRKLMNRFDFFLLDNKLAKIRAGLFKKFVPIKVPIPVKLTPESKLKSNIEKALRKVLISFRGKGFTQTILFGHHKMKVNMLVDNLKTILKELFDEIKYPGGQDNIRSIFIKSTRSPGFPLYISTKSPNLVKDPQPKVVEKDEGVEGELSTFPDRIVTVFKDGRVKTKKIKPQKEVNSRVQKNAQKQKVEKSKVLKKNEDDDDEGEEEVDEDSFMEEDTDEDEDVEESEEDEDVEESDDDDDEEEEEEEEDDDEDEEEVSGEDEEDIQNVFKGIKKLNKNKRKNESSTDEEQLEEAEQYFLKELRKQQDKIESEGQAKKAQVKPQPKNLNKMQMQKKGKKAQPNKNSVPTGRPTAGKANKQLLSQNKKRIQPQANANTNVTKKNDEIQINKFNKKWRKNKQGNSNQSAQNRQGSQKSRPPGKKFKAKGL